MTLADLHEHLESHTGEELFEDVGKDHPDYRKWARMCHPDIAKDGKDTFLLLETRMRESTQGIIITSKGGMYELERTPFDTTGSICDVFLTKDGTKLAKISRNDRRMDFMTNEAAVLEKITPNEDNHPTLWNMLPHIEDKFTIGKRNHGKRRVHIMDYDPNFLTLEYIHSKWPDGVEPETFAWIFKRILLALHVVHRAGYVHGAVIPQHFLAHKEDHSGRLIDFIHAVPIGEPIKAQVKNKRFYPKEVLDKEPATPETDIYMAGKVGVYLLGGCLSTGNLPGSVPGRIRGFLSALLIDDQSRRPDNAWELHEDFSEVLGRVFGTPKYHEFTGV